MHIYHEFLCIDRLWLDGGVFRAGMCSKSTCTNVQVCVIYKGNYLQVCRHSFMNYLFRLMQFLAFGCMETFCKDPTHSFIDVHPGL